MTTSSRSNAEASAQADASGFIPQQPLLECASFSVSFKFLAVAIVTLAALWIWQMWSQGQLHATWQSSGWLVAALAMMAWTEWHILRGKTRLTADALEQSWVWHKRVALRELAYAKLFRVPGLDWLIAPRLYTKTFGNKLAVLYVTGPAMLAEMQRLEQYVQANARR